MCYYKGMRVTRRELFELLAIEKMEREDEIEDQYTQYVHSGFNYRKTEVLVPEPGCKWALTEMEWGFIPQYWFTRADVEKHRRGYKDEKGKFNPPITTLNAMGEELLYPRKMYREAALKRRCLLPVTDFYEWRHIFPIGKKGEPLKTAVKYPYRIGLKEKDIFLIAGIWQSWTARDTGATVDTCALVTTKANSLMEQVHNSKKRMPTILTEELAGEWISDGLSEERITEIATYQMPADQMEAYTVRKDFLSATNPNEAFINEGLPVLEM